MASLDNIEMLMTALLEKLNLENDSIELYGEYLMRWYETYKLPLNGANTSKFMYFYINSRIIPALGDIPLAKLSGDRIQAFLNGIPKGNTRNKIAQIIKGSLTKAVKLRLLRYNPFDAVDVKTHKKKHYRALTLQEQSNVARGMTNKLYIAVLYVLICTGMRIGEFLAVESPDVDFNYNLIAVHHTVDIQSGELQDRTKTYTSMRNIAFLPMLSPYLITLIDYVKRHGRLSYNQVKQYFKKLYKKLNIVGLNLHSLRHTFGCMCYRAGISDKMIQHLMGHASLDVTMNVYVDVLGAGTSPFTEYFEEYKKDLEKRPTDFWRYFPP